ncbi:MAG: DsrE family protein [Thiovulaceae bacterium]|nr:DsrE family protein [Sulfurimonadaceae bacterium]
MVQRLITIFLLLILGGHADTLSPWGDAKLLPTEYRPQKVLYDVDYGSLKKLSNILDRVSYLNKLYKADPFDSSIIIILHGESIPFFAKENTRRYKALLTRAYGLTLDGVIEFRMCQAAAKAMHYTAKDIHGFITMVPMADAEIVRLQKEEDYAYMR